MVGAAITVALVVIGAASVGMLFRDLDDVGASSPLRFLVDREIRGVPLSEPTASVRFRSVPADGNRPALSSATIAVKDVDKARAVVRSYLLKLGYDEQEGAVVFVKPEVEVRLAKTENGELAVTKYSWK